MAAKRKAVGNDDLAWQISMFVSGRGQGHGPLPLLIPEETISMKLAKRVLCRIADFHRQTAVWSSSDPGISAPAVLPVAFLGTAVIITVPGFQKRNDVQCPLHTAGYPLAGSGEGSTARVIAWMEL